MMNDLFWDEVNDGNIFIYMDDILIATTSLAEHRPMVKQVLQKLQDANLFLKPKKCDFEQQEIEYLGLKIRPGQIAMDPVKVKGALDWPVPKCLRDICAFLSFAGFYR
jgi:hypothetical protein